MNCYMIFEQSDGLESRKEHIEQYVIGIKTQIRKSKSKLIMIDENSLSEPIEYFKQKSKRPVVILAGFTVIWIYKYVSLLLSQGIHPLVLSPCSSMGLNNVSMVSLNDIEATERLCRYFSSNGLERIAYFGYNPNFFSHKVQMSAFVKYKRDNKLPWMHLHNDCYANFGIIDDCSAVFMTRVSSYDAVICSTPACAVKLLNDLKKHNLSNHNLKIAAIGSSPLSKLISPKLTTFEFDAKLCGERAAKLYSTLVNNPDISMLAASISGRLQINESTSFMEEKQISTFPTVQPEPEIHPNFVLSSDTDMSVINRLENLIYKCDDIDIDFIDSVCKNKDMKYFAEEHFISENTLNYRVQNMIKTLGISSRKELYSILCQWFGK